MNEQGRFVDIILLCVAGVLLPILLLSSQLERVQNTTLQGRISSFAEMISTKGYVDCLLYESFIKELDATGVLAIPEFYVTHEILAPEYRMRTIEDARGYLDGLFDGSNVLHQDIVTTERPLVKDPGKPSESLSGESVDGTELSISGPSAAHSHTAMCYKGIQHWHDENCLSKRVRCGAGCSLHVHTGSSSSGTGCYNGTYIEPTREYCGSISVVSSTASPGGITCGNGHEMTYYYEEYVCSGCGNRTSSGFYRCECWRDLHDMYSHYIYCGGGYSMNCTKSTSVYYKDNSKCFVCNGTGYVDSTACTKTEGSYYDVEGNVCSPLCNEVVVLLTPVGKKQVLMSGSSPDIRAKAVFADGHSEIVNGILTGFNRTAHNVIQTVTLSYGTYSGTLMNPQKSSCTVKIMVCYADKTCESGHSYYLVSGESTLCPYCREYPKTLTVIGAAERPFCITKGSSLADNGVRIKVTYYDGHYKIIDSGWTDNLDNDYVGEQLVRIGYQGAETSLLIKTERVNAICSDCGYEYALYPDNTDPGCPKCLSAIPVFTGEILRYTESTTYREILDELYHGKGIYYFSKGDRLEMRLWKQGNMAAANVFGTLFGPGAGKELICMYSVRIRDETVRGERKG